MDNAYVKCPSVGEAATAYLYDEMSLIERQKFEDHLLDCLDCTDDFAVLADSRYAVYDWHRSEFAQLETPRIVIDYGARRLGLFAAVRNAFALRPVLSAAGGFALLAVAFAIADSVSLTNRGLEVSDAVTLPSVLVDETVEPTLAAAAPTLETSDPEIGPQVVRATSSGTASKRQDPARPRRKNTVKRSELVAGGSPSTPRAEPATTTPRLNEFVDAADQGLRLQDLVADSDSRD
jgi:hypothetical protein